MAAIPCDRRTICFPCSDDGSNPFVNLSSEAPDNELFLGRSYFDWGNAPAGWNNPFSCATFCESSASQIEADDCAARQARECVWDEPTDNTPNPPPGTPPPTFYNVETTCTCGANMYTVAAGTVVSTSQVDADAIAASLCNARCLTDGTPIGPSPPPPEPPDDCPIETGSAAPDTLEISALVDWETFTMNPALLTPYVSAFCNPNKWWVMNVPGEVDHPPGTYEVRYVSGLLDRLDVGVPCPPGEIKTLVGLFAVWDDENNFDIPDPCSNFTPLLNTSNIINPQPPHGGDIYTNTECAVDYTASEALHQALFNAPGAERAWIYTFAPPPPDGGVHSNTGGLFRYAWDDTFLDPSTGLAEVPGFELTFRMTQRTGLIAQPRTLAISPYDSHIAEFADPAAAAAWNGFFDDRTTYTAMTLEWDVSDSGAFGGASVEYTMAHPTSANGKGWMLEIYSAGAILMYRAFKAVGDTPIGRYYKDSTTTPIGPDCLTCVDTSTQDWEPPA